jgi:hypothetical protein
LTVQASPGTVLAVWTSSSLAANLIRAGEALVGKPAVANHVILVTHLDAKGRWVGIQGQPGGVGLADCTPFLSDPRTRSNSAQVAAMRASQPGFNVELATYLASCAKSIGVRYDWVGIAEDTADALRLNDVSALLNRIYAWPADHHEIPGEVVCSSLAAWQYENAGWPHPDLGTERSCEPADWWDWSDRKLWTGPR